MEGARPASTSSYFARPRAARLLLRVHSAEGLRHVSAAGAYCKLYVGAVEMVRGSRHYRQSLGRKGGLSASASAHSLSRLLHAPGDAQEDDRGADDVADGRMKVLKTQVVKGKRPNVVWNEKFDVEVADPAREVLSVRVKSARLMASPSIGACAVSLRMLPGVTVDRWVDLMDGRKPAGRIRLQLRLVDDAADATDVDPMSHSWPSPVANAKPNNASTSSTESETAASSPTLLITPIPGNRPAPGSARRYRESRRKRELSVRALAASQLKTQSLSPQSDHQQHDSNQVRTSEDNLSGMDYERNSAPTADSAPATTRVSFNSFVHTPSSPGVTPPKPRANASPQSSPGSSPPVEDPDSDSDHVPDDLPPAPLAQGALKDRGTMTMDELDKSRLHMSALGPSVAQHRRKARKPSVAPRESSRVHFDSDSDSDFGDLSDDDDDVVAVQAPQRTHSPQRSVVIFEDDEEVVRAQQEKLRLTDRTTASAGTPSVISVAASDYDLEGNRSHSTGPEDDSDEYSDEEDEDEESDEEPRIPLNASLTKLLCRFSANVLIEDEDEDEEDDDVHALMGEMDEFVPIMDFAEHAPVDDIDCA